jgi:hypothetical protein
MLLVEAGTPQCVSMHVCARVCMQLMLSRCSTTELHPSLAICLFATLEVGPRALCLLGMHSTTRAVSQSFGLYLASETWSH